LLELGEFDSFPAFYARYPILSGMTVDRCAPQR
jgi:hypothetical protein